MTNPAKFQLLVSWQMMDPPVQASRWHSWDLAELTGINLEPRLAWPSGSLMILLQAFAAKLPRTVGWQLSNTSEAIDAAMSMAARVYRRGVAYSMSSRETSGSYPINILDDQLNNSTQPPIELLSPITSSEEFIVIDAQVLQLWPELALPASAYAVQLDEHTKTLTAVADILSAWQQAGRPTQWCVIGGGLLTDVVAFAAGLQSCHVRFVPTTLLAMADACVGGKTGVNFPPFGKNQVGLFYFPERVDVWTGWLRTLPLRELRAGGIECLKHALLAGSKPLAQRLAQALQTNNLATISEALPEVMQFKADIVASDPTEQAERAILNFGHTLGHALEAYSHTHTQGPLTLLHGEAVGVGLVFAIHLSCEHAGLDPIVAGEMIALLRTSSCLITRTELQRGLGIGDAQALEQDALLSNLIQHIEQDKKADAATSRWVLLAGWGKPARDAATNAHTIGLPLSVSLLQQAWHATLTSLSV